MRLRILFIYVIVSLYGINSWASAKCVQIFYDGVPQLEETHNSKYFGMIHSIFLQNILGHFPHVQQYLIPIELYQSGDIEQCSASIYLGTYFDNAIPPAFFEDFAKTKKNVVWAGYNIWQIDTQVLDQIWKVRYRRQTELDWSHLDGQGKPGFYRYFTYLGETFIKFAEFDLKDKKTFKAAYEITEFSYVKDEVDPYVLSWAQHSTIPSQIPYVLRNRNHWYVGDSPFSFTTEEDRYLIFADLLFDILDEKPIHNVKPAIFRIEDVHAKIPIWQLYKISGMLKQRNIPYSLALIPYFLDPHGAYSGGHGNFTSIAANPSIVDYLKEVQNEGVGFIFHGVTHQYRQQRNPFDSISGNDFEFWDVVNNSPVGKDSADFVIERIEDGVAVFDSIGIKPFAWEVPHYQASPLDYNIFAELFHWNIGRIVYFPFQKSGFGRLPNGLTIDEGWKRGKGQRLTFFQESKVEYPEHLLPNGQFFPYEIYGDVYGQRVLPENIGNFQPFLSAHVHYPKTLEDLTRIVRRNRVLRDVWASFFVHVHMLNTSDQWGVGRFTGDTKDIETLIDVIEESGYQFVDLSEWVQKRIVSKRNPTINRDFKE